MEEQIIKPVVVPPVTVAATHSQTTEYLIYFAFGILEVLLGIRLILKLTGASNSSGFVRLIYTFTSIFILPFDGIFHKAVTQGLETAAVLEPSTIVALVVYGLLSFGIVKLVRIFSGAKQEE